MIKISRDVYLVEKLSIKMLIDMNILDLEEAIVNLLAKRLRLSKNISCSLIVKFLEKRQERIV